MTSEGGKTRRRNRDVAHREDAEQPVVINSANQGVNVYTQDFLVVIFRQNGRTRRFESFLNVNLVIVHFSDEYRLESVTFLQMNVSNCGVLQVIIICQSIFLFVHFDHAISSSHNKSLIGLKSIL